MTLSVLRTHCLAKSGASESYPFGAGASCDEGWWQIFAIIGEEAEPLTVSVKCEPEIADVLRAAYDAVRPGYHLNKRHWNTVTLDGTINKKQVLEWVDDSYDLVMGGLPRRVREEIGGKSR
jgi:predicted DNA-binding protein (MmcQ/YjbR family)